MGPDGKLFPSLRHALAFIIKNGANEEEVRKQFIFLQKIAFPPKMYAGAEDERLHGLGRVEVAQAAAQHLEGEGRLP